ncbi:hypothetical protein K2F43_14865 [Clostridium estertheticum]|uniref:hypothetical protein n=1 Tax=Clostridium estertheticum TaxID=238834 RepID=UPI001C6F0F6F|nr:hypothetical protein [Clostridium estertheticum]MBW9172489.1 hypothetical protein [Clostridium estertheticum]WLC76551.1 hypothetical protein KTC99_07055 [Clostridium estertheticum]
MTTEGAIDLGRNLRDSLTAGADLIDKVSEDASVQEYAKLQEQLNSILINNMSNLGWVHKYYHMLYSDKIDAFHTTRWEKHALIYSNSKSVQENELYTMSGQLMKIVKQTGLPSSYVMNSMCELFGYPKKYFRIGTGDNGDSYWQDMGDNSYIGIGWPKLGNLNLYFESKDVKNDIAVDLIKYYEYGKSAVCQHSCRIF